MESTEFEALIDDSGAITIPADVKKIVFGKKVRVVLWYQANGELPSSDIHYTKGYDQKDTLYDAY